MTKGRREASVGAEGSAGAEGVVERFGLGAGLLSLSCASGISGVRQARARSRVKYRKETHLFADDLNIHLLSLVALLLLRSSSGGLLLGGDLPSQLTLLEQLLVLGVGEPAFDDNLWGKFGSASMSPERERDGNAKGQRGRAEVNERVGSGKDEPRA